LNFLHVLGYAVALYLASGVCSFISNFISSFLEAAKHPLSSDALFILKRTEDMAELCLWVVVIAHALRHSTPSPYIDIVGAMAVVTSASFFLEKKFRKSSNLVFWIRVPVSFAACLLFASYVVQHAARPNLALVTQ